MTQVLSGAQHGAEDGGTLREDAGVIGGGAVSIEAVSIEADVRVTASGTGATDAGRARQDPDPLEVTYLGRSTVLIGLDGVRFLTDPYLPAPVISWYRRVPAPEPPAVDAVLVSHGHMRHMNVATLRRLPGSPRILAAPGEAAFLRDAGFRRVEQVEPGDVISVDGVAVQAIAGEHAALHAAFPPRHAPVGFLLEGTASVYFAGDSTPRESDRMHGPDLALLPVAPVLRYVGHLSPSDAAESAALARPRVVVPIHWATPGLDDLMPPWLPRRELFTAQRLEADLRRAFEARGVTAELCVLGPGYSTTVMPAAPAPRLASAFARETVPSRSATGAPSLR